MNWTRKISRRRLLTLTGISCVGGYMRLLEPEWLEVTHHTVRLSGRHLPKPIKILHLSDLHASKRVTLEYIARAVKLGLSLNPDLVLLTGDFISSRFDQFARYAEILARLAKAAPSFACLGNHDGGLWARRKGYADTRQVRQLLVDSGVRLLHNQSEQIRLQETNLWLVGLGDLWAQECEPAVAFATTRAEANLATLVLSHNPDTKEQLQNYTWDMLFCGHTHGGQLYLPLIGTPFAPVEDKQFVEGLHDWRGRHIFITRGVGNVLGVRFNCRPEVSLITLN